MPIRIPVQFLDNSLQPAKRPHEGRAMVHVHLRDETTVSGTNFRADPQWALLDTGADWNYADPDLLDRLGVPVISAGSVIGATGIAAAGIREMGVALGPLDACCVVTTTVMDLSFAHDQAKPYRMILGNLFMESGILHLDHLRREYWFDYYLAHERQAA